jgi:1,4-alpha-glucan branching enzyme
VAIRLDTSDRRHLLITFTLEPDRPPGAVSVVGSFNDWTPGRHELRCEVDDPMRHVTVPVPYGEPVHFRYLAADGMWFDEPEADEVTGHGSVVRAVAAPTAKSTAKKAATKKAPATKPVAAKKTATKKVAAKKPPTAAG